MARKKSSKKSTAKTTIPAAKIRKGILAYILPWLKRFGTSIAAIIIFAWICAWLSITGTFTRAINWGHEQFLTQTSQAGFRIEKLLVEGRIYTDPALLLALINAQKGDPLFAVAPKEAKQLLEETKWIEFAHIQRRLPDTLYIKLIERQPMAVYIDADNNRHLLDTRGIPIENENTENFAQLMTVSGQNADTSAPALIALLLKNPIIFEKTISATRQGNRRWDLDVKSNNGNIITLKMPDNDSFPHALKRISDAELNEQILQRPAVQSIDMRFENKIIIRTKPGQVIDYQQSISNKKQGV